MTDSLGNAFAPKAPGITITQFQSFKRKRKIKPCM